jgi:2-oxo-4-hydroxy-4-carboxy-5-ureidoimidazoline decarboxylase
MTETTLGNANRMSEADFVAAFGDVAEHAPWVAREAAGSRPFASREAMIAAFVAAVENAPETQQRALLAAHPDLAGKAAIAGDITADSRREQAGAGLDRLTAAEHARLTELNAAYRARHAIPFIYAVRGATKEEIMRNCAERLPNAPEAEFATALAHVARIIAFRLEDRVRS